MTEICFILHVHVNLDNVLFALKKVFSQAKDWALLLTSMHGPGYAKNKPITPYMHVMLCHLPGLLQDLGSVKMFTGQGKK